MEKFIVEDRSIKYSVLRKLPFNAKILALVHTEDMSGKKREAMLVMIPEKGYIRQAYFCLETGKYISDKFPEDDARVI